MMKTLLAPLLALVLSACGGGGPLGDPQPLSNAMLSGKTVRGAGGVELVMDQWPSQGATRAVILAVHGYGDTGPLTYDAAARAWAARGISVYSYDQRGFGRNPSFGQWPGAETLIADLVEVSAAVRARHPGTPLIVVGHSMGAGVALAAARQGLAADRLVLAGPAIAGGAEVNPGLRLGGWLLVNTAPDKRFTGEGLVEINPTDNAEALQRAWDDPHKIAEPSGRELWGLLRILDLAYDAAPLVDTPTLVLIGRNDQVVDPNGVIRTARRIPGRVGTIAYPDGWHWLFRDTDSPTVWADIADFALARRLARPAR